MSRKGKQKVKVVIISLVSLILYNRFINQSRSTIIFFLIFSDHNNAGIHIAIYIDKFKERYALFKKHNIIWTNPRFLAEDTCDTEKEACENRQFRFRDIIDPNTEEKLFELEHETRSLRHFQFMKQVAY